MPVSIQSPQLLLNGLVDMTYIIVYSDGSNSTGTVAGSDWSVANSTYYVELPLSAPTGATVLYATLTATASGAYIYFTPDSVITVGQSNSIAVALTFKIAS